MAKLDIVERRMFELIEYSIENNLVPTQEAFFGYIGFFRQNKKKVLEGKQQFSRNNIQKACQLTGANANWILGLEDNMLRENQMTGVDYLKAALVAVEKDLSGKKVAVTAPVTRKKKSK